MCGMLLNKFTMSFLWISVVLHSYSWNVADKCRCFPVVVVIFGNARQLRVNRLSTETNPLTLVTLGWLHKATRLWQFK